jgi:hypothetical protein
MLKYKISNATKIQMISLSSCGSKALGWTCDLDERFIKRNKDSDDIIIFHVVQKL